MTIQPFSNETQTKWDHEEFQVMIMAEGNSRPLGFCDGDAADEQQIREQAANEGAEVEIDRKVLKTGREIWTVRAVAQL